MSSWRLSRWGLVGVLAIGAWGSALAQSPLGQVHSPTVAPTTKVPDCTTSGCHSSQVNRPFLHGPNAVRACDACHEYVDPATHKFELKRTGKDLCNFCHIDKTGTEDRFVHEPLAKGMCLSCHDPHGSGHRKMLRKDTMTQLCVECHKTTINGSHTHGPVAQDCTNCHRPHTAPEAKLLTAPSPKLCLTCHEDVAKGIASVKHPHDPLKGDCLQCHTPHASDQTRLLKADTASLCVSCHQDIGKAITASTHAHSAVGGDRACLNCHTPHGSDHPLQMKKDTVSTCLECHDKPIQVNATHTIVAVPELADEKLFRHGPVAKGECAACHTVHGGALGNLLIAPVTAEIYQPFSEEAYALCFRCHDRSTLLAVSGQKQTNFRDGTRNLHILHVSQGPKGRSCRVCHSPHASRFEAMINDDVQYGQWKLPIGFSPTDTGGSCAPGCHKVERYDRVSPIGKIQLSPAAPASNGPPALAPSK